MPRSGTRSWPATPSPRSLSSTYGDASLYPQIFEANRDQLTDPDKIRVGQKLRIP